MNRSRFVFCALVAACGAPAAPPPAATAPTAPASTAPTAATASAPVPPAASASAAPAPTHYVAVMDFTDAGMSGDTDGLPSPFGGLSNVTPKPTGSGVRQGQLQVSGRLLPELVARVLNSQHGRYVLCGTTTNATPGDRVSVKFVIDSKGVVTTVTDAGSTTKSPAVVSCIERVILGLSFPAPDAGTVTVIDPMTF